MEFQNIIQFNIPIVPKQHFKYVIIELLQLSNSNGLKCEVGISKLS
jgi:hypothetical protein